MTPPPTHPPTHIHMPSPTRCISLFGLAGMLILPIFVELLLGGSSAAKILLKIVTRLVTLWWATSRALEIVKALAVARDLENRSILPSLKSLPSRNKLKGGVNKARQDSVVTRAQKRERTARSREGPKPVPVWIVIGHLAITWTFCVFALTRLAELDEPCRTTPPWSNGHCRVRAYPLFNLALPAGQDNVPTCACNTFAVIAPKTGNNDSDCSSPAFMETVHRHMIQKGAPAAKYIQGMVFLRGCALNNTHAFEMLNTSHLPNLRVVFLSETAPVEAPLVLPAWTTESKIMLLRLITGP